MPKGHVRETSGRSKNRKQELAGRDLQNAAGCTREERTTRRLTVMETEEVIEAGGQGDGTTLA